MLFREVVVPLTPKILSTYPTGFDLTDSVVLSRRVRSRKTVLRFSIVRNFFLVDKVRPVSFTFTCPHDHLPLFGALPFPTPTIIRRTGVTSFAKMMMTVRNINISIYDKLMDVFISAKPSPPGAWLCSSHPPGKDFFVYYGSIKREVNKRLIFECRCDARLSLLS